MSDIVSENFVMNIQATGSVDGARMALAKGANLNYVDAEGNSAAHHAVLGEHLEALRFLIAEGIDLELADGEGNTALHLACQKESREMILALLIGGADPTKKNNENQKPGEKNGKIYSFVAQIAAENKAFKALGPEQRQKLQQIYNEIAGPAKHINLDMTKMFNMHVNEVDEEEAERDAKDFIASCAICNEERVSFDEWCFAFSKLWVCEQPAYEKFIEDYENALNSKGPFQYR